MTKTKDVKSHHIPRTDSNQSGRSYVGA